MAIQVQGNGGVIADVGGTTFRALKVQQMPLDYGSLGIYRKSLTSGTMAAGLAAGSTVYSWRWGDTTRLGVAQKIVVDGMGIVNDWKRRFKKKRVTHKGKKPRKSTKRKK